MNAEITEFLKQNGCDIVGFADLRCLSNEVRQNFDYGILIGLPYTKKAMQDNINDDPQRYYDELRQISKRLEELACLTADLLADKGYKAWAKLNAMNAYSGNYNTVLPHKTVATLAGIGWIGKCAMLVTKEVGSALRIITVLTNAPFECGVPQTKSLCSPNCNICADICPGNAVLGSLWEAGISREEFYDASACLSAARSRAKELLNIEETICGLCISACPFTKKGR